MTTSPYLPTHPPTYILTASPPPAPPAPALAIPPLIPPNPVALKSHLDNNLLLIHLLSEYRTIVDRRMLSSVPRSILRPVFPDCYPSPCPPRYSCGDSGLKSSGVGVEWRWRMDGGVNDGRWRLVMDGRMDAGRCTTQACHRNHTSEAGQDAPRLPQQNRSRKEQTDR